MTTSYTPLSMPFDIVWSESASHLGPFGGCELSVYERDSEDSPPVWSRSFKRQIAQISKVDRKRYESIALTAAREFMRKCHEADQV